MNARANDIGSYLRGIAYPPTGDVAYPRIRQLDASRLTGETWEAATCPVGVRLEMIGTARAVDVAYRTRRDDEAVFTMWRNGHQIDERKAVLGDGVARLNLGKGEPDNRAVVYLPDSMQPVISAVVPINGLLEPAPLQQRWLVSGDAITQGRLASTSARSWPSIVGRKVGLDLVNFGFAGAGPGDIHLAEHLVEQAAAVITISASSNIWDLEPHTVGMAYESTIAALGLVRRGHPATPIIVVSQLIRPDAEAVANRLGATLADLRTAVEDAVTDLIADGDAKLSLVPGSDILAATHLVDKVHPGDEGHTRIAAKLAVAVYDVLQAGGPEESFDALRPEGGRPSAGTTFGPEFIQGGVPESHDHGFVGDGTSAEPNGSEKSAPEPTARPTRSRTPGLKRRVGPEADPRPEPEAL